MNSLPDDEMCDLETLEALLNEDNDNDSNSLQTPGHSNKGKVEYTGLSKELAEFMNAESDDSEEEMTVPGNKDKNLSNSKETAEKQKSPSKSIAKLHGPSSKSSSSGCYSKGERKSGNESQISCMESTEPKQDPSATSALMEEMAKMQKKMEELQRMLQTQQHKEEVSKDTAKKDVSSPPTRPASKESGATVQAPKLRLMADEEEGNIFFSQQKSTPLKSSPPLKHSRKTTLSNKKLDGTKSVKPLREDSDSDWEDMDGENNRSLSEEGKNLKRLLKLGEKKKEVYRSKFDPSPQTEQLSSRELNTKLNEDKIKNVSKNRIDMVDDKHSLQCASSSTDQGKSSSQKLKEPEKIVTEDFSRIRIISPLISSSVMKMRMEGRKLIALSRIHAKLNTPDLQGDWVTIGVVVSKSNAKASSSGKPYSIWRLSDLHDLEQCASFFLFGQVHKNHWKLDVGSVVGLLNPSLMDAMEKGKSEPAFTLKNPNQMMIMGISKDLGWCIGQTKKGNKCTHFLNKKQGDYCSYHVQAEYRKTSAQRLEFHGSVTGLKPKSFEQKIFSKNCAYMYGGSTFIPNSSSSDSNKKKGVTLSKLQEKITSSHTKINTFTIQDIKPSVETVAKARKITEDQNDLFMDMIAMPSPGSMNLVAHLKKNKEKRSPSINKSGNSKEGQIIESISASDLLKQHRQKLRMGRAAKPKASDLLLSSTSDHGFSSPPNSAITRCNPLKEMPALGKGLSSGQYINLNLAGERSAMPLASRSKLKAIHALQNKNKGSIQKEDPNAVRKAKGEKEITAIRKRLHEEDDSSDSNRTDSKSSPSTSSSQRPKVKRSKLLGNVDINSAEVKAILKAKSKHVGALAEKELEREETYFEGLEKKEVLEEKMQSVTSIEINVFTCKQCHYTAQSALDQCKQEQHSIVKSKAKKRFFGCKKCKHRTSTINGMYPCSPCQKCGSLCYEKTSMYKEKKGPTLESEILSLRGDEMKFLNSFDHKVFMNTVID